MVTMPFMNGEHPWHTPDERLALLLDTIAEVTSTLDIGSLLIRIVDRSLDLTGAERGLLVLREQGEEETPRVARDRGGRHLPLDLPFSRTVVREVLRTREPQVHEVTAAEADGLDLSKSMVAIGLRRLMCVPLSFEGAAIGAIYVDSNVGLSRPFGGANLRLLQALAQQAAIAIVNARLREAELSKERLEARMRIAGEIQQRAFPPNGLLLSEFDVYGISLPCEETCGDYFDYIPRRGRHWGLVVGDVVGHGLEAALYMLTARGGLRSSFAWIDDAPLVFEHLNRELHQDMDIGQFVTLLYVDLDVAAKTFRFLAAGHPPPLLYRARLDDFEELPTGGPLLGAGLEAEYRNSESIAMECGDVLVLYTDGIPESRRPVPVDAPPEFFGEDRLREAVRRRSGQSSRAIVEGILAEVAEFLEGSEPDDDRTLVVATAASDGG